jgi:hypothetical protein
MRQASKRLIENVHQNPSTLTLQTQQKLNPIKMEKHFIKELLIKIKKNRFVDSNFNPLKS